MASNGGVKTPVPVHAKSPVPISPVIVATKFNVPPLVHVNSVPADVIFVVVATAKSSPTTSDSTNEEHPLLGFVATTVYVAASLT